MTQAGSKLDQRGILRCALCNVARHPEVNSAALAVKVRRSQSSAFARWDSSPVSVAPARASRWKTRSAFRTADLSSFPYEQLLLPNGPTTGSSGMPMSTQSLEYPSRITIGANPGSTPDLTSTPTLRSSSDPTPPGGCREGKGRAMGSGAVPCHRMCCDVVRMWKRGTWVRWRATFRADRRPPSTRQQVSGTQWLVMGDPLRER